MLNDGTYVQEGDGCRSKWRRIGGERFSESTEAKCVNGLLATVLLPRERFDLKDSEE